MLQPVRAGACIYGDGSQSGGCNRSPISTSCPTTKKAGATTRRAARRSGRRRRQSDLLRRSRQLGTPPRTTASAGAGCSKRWSNGSRRAATTSAWTRARFLAIAVRRADDGRVRLSCCPTQRSRRRQRYKGQQDRHLGPRHARRRRNHRPARHRHQAIQAAGRAQLHQALSASRSTDTPAEQTDDLRIDAARALALLFENRRQYPRAAEYWRQAIERSTGDDANSYQSSGSIRSSATGASSKACMSQPAGRGATVDFRFRNAKQVEFDAHADRRRASCSTT